MVCNFLLVQPKLLVLMKMLETDDDILYINGEGVKYDMGEGRGRDHTHDDLFVMLTVQLSSQLAVGSTAVAAVVSVAGCGRGVAPGREV